MSIAVKIAILIGVLLVEVATLTVITRSRGGLPSVVVAALLSSTVLTLLIVGYVLFFVIE